MVICVLVRRSVASKTDRFRLRKQIMGAITEAYRWTAAQLTHERIRLSVGARGTHRRAYLA